MAVTISSPTRSGAGPTDAALVVAARAGESWAQEALFRRHARMALGLAHRLLPHDDEVDDIVQDCFVSALKRLSSLDNPQAFAAWLGSIVVRAVGKRLRRRRLLSRLGLRAPEEIDPDAIAAPSVPGDVAVELRRVYAVVARCRRRRGGAGAAAGGRAGGARHRAADGAFALDGETAFENGGGVP